MYSLCQICRAGNTNDTIKGKVAFVILFLKSFPNRPIINHRTVYFKQLHFLNL